MSKILCGTLLVLVTLTGTMLAQEQVDTKGLSVEQVKALSAAAEQLRKQPANTIANLSLENATPDKFKEWADAGEAAGKAVSSFTKEIGVAADQFLRTDVGRLGMFVIIWKVGGDTIAASAINTFLDLTLALILYTFWWKLTRRFVFNERLKKSVVYNENTFLRWLGFNKKEKSWEKDTDWMAKWEKDDQFWIIFWSRFASVTLLIFITLYCWPTVSF